MQKIKKILSDNLEAIKFEDKLNKELYNFPANFSTDELYDMLPSMIRFHNELLIGEYFLYIYKSTAKKQTSVNYIDNDNKYLGSTHRSGKTLREALINMHNWLNEFNYK